MKKLIALMMVCGFAFAFVACGGGAKQDDSAKDSTAAQTTDTPAPAADTTKTDTTKAQ